MKRFLRGMSHYLVFFLMVAFLVTCCIMLFTHTLMATLGVELTGENLEIAAKLTFGNVILLSMERKELSFALHHDVLRRITTNQTANPFGLAVFYIAML